MAYMTKTAVTGEAFEVAWPVSRNSRPCCSPYHDEDPRNCYHCGYPVRGRCYCSDADIAERDRQTAQFYADAMHCWCGGCETEDEEGRPMVIYPAPCAQRHWQQMADRADQDEEDRYRAHGPL